MTESTPPSVIAAIIGVAGTVALALLTWVGRAIAQIFAERQEIKELLRALHAEVTDKLQISEVAFSKYDVHQICDKMREEKSYYPYITLEPYSSPVFDSAINDIPKLPAAVIKPVIDFYRWDRVTHAAFANLMTEEVKRLEVGRRVQLFENTAELWKEHLHKARAAADALEKQMNKLDQSA
jgi:hypothetical protein